MRPANRFAGTPIWLTALGRMEEFSIDDLPDVDMSEEAGEPTNEPIEMGAMQAGEADDADSSAAQVAHAQSVFLPCIRALSTPPLRASGSVPPLSAIGLRTPPPCRLAPVIASQTPSELC